jgi:uncharacterized protein YkwD
MAPRRPRSLVLLVVVTALTAALVADAGGAAVAATDLARWPMKRETNESRVLHDVRRVDLRTVMSELARRHSVRMARRGELFHTPNPPGYYLDGVSWSAWGENVGYTTGTVEGLQRLFMRSAPHRANILNRRFRHVAIGTARRNGVLWVTVFFYG